MGLRRLEYFVAVAGERHVTEAAQRLVLSPSGPSASVRALERESGSALFVERHPQRRPAASARSVEPAGAGRAPLGEAPRALVGETFVDRHPDGCARRLTDGAFAVAAVPPPPGHGRRAPEPTPPARPRARHQARGMPAPAR
ncbi:helix-turn-helix domain-containing protein [Actinacidiphila yeochonensis]|uniref:helix-turn-helix domain-containing protein n=1 Tax=Actinacidiphila yeochonensis TaxID=89050 RepID=UPI00056BF863|nr:LysR family transcriptional regulator [Actinacidiphila yeochonensis]